MCSFISRFDKSLYNVIHLGVAFLTLFSADFTINNLQKTINTSVSEENPEYGIDGYLTLCLLYALYGITLCLAPSFLSVIGYKISLIIGGIGLSFYIFSLVFERVWVSYLGILMGGAAGSFLWVAEGQYLVLNSNHKTMSRNVGVFWAIYSAAMIGGNVYAATQLEGMVHIERPVRRNLLLVMGTMALVAVLMFIVLPDPPEEGGTYQEKDRPMEALRKTWRLFCSKDMAILLATFIYGGFQQSFGTGVYSACLGFTKDFGTTAKQLVPIAGLLFGVGDSLGGIIHMILTRTQIFIRRRYVIIFGLSIQTVAYASIYVNLPNSSVFGETDEPAIIKPMIWLALICSFLIGIGDSCLNTQIFPLLRDLHPEYSAHTCSLYKFSKSMAMAVSFFCSSYLGLHLQLSLMFLTGIVGAAAFFYVDIRQTARQESSQKLNQISVTKM